MQLIPILVPLAVVAILGGAVWYIVRQKRRGVKCIGCPYAKQCRGGFGCPSNPRSDEENA